jgi:ABC-type antimicrobial peptide transport system permease subunit
VDRQALQTSIASNPIEAGMRGLLLVGALTAAALAVLGTIVQSALAARQRVVQFAVLRTMGMASRQLTGVLLSEQVAVYIFGLLGGTVLGALLATATLPFLQFGDTAIDPATLGVPPYVLSIDLTNLAWFYLALVLAFVVALAIAARYAATIGLGKTLRLGED